MCGAFRRPNFSDLATGAANFSEISRGYVGKVPDRDGCQHAASTDAEAGAQDLTFGESAAGVRVTADNPHASSAFSESEIPQAALLALLELERIDELAAEFSRMAPSDLLDQLGHWLEAKKPG